MSDQNTEQGDAPDLHGASDTDDETSDHPRRDDRNEEVDESPVPDPTAKDTNAGDDPEAD